MYMCAGCLEFFAFHKDILPDFLLKTLCYHLHLDQQFIWTLILCAL